MKRALLALLIVLAAAPPAWSAFSFRVVANVDVPANAISRAGLSSIFYKRTAKWENGLGVVPVDQGEQSPVRALFTMAIHGKRVTAVKSYWQQQIFAGLDVPPVEKATDADVLAFVRTTPGAIGYVSTTAATAGVKVVEIR